MAKINVLTDKQNGQILTDKQNRQLIFKGINSSNHSKNESFPHDNSEFNPWEKKEDIEKQINEYGFSVVRYLIFWKGP